jgi:hypothetical protein
MVADSQNVEKKQHTQQAYMEKQNVVGCLFRGDAVGSEKKITLNMFFIRMTSLSNMEAKKTGKIYNKE